MVCKLKTGESNVEDLFRALESIGLRASGPKLSRDGVEIEVLGSSIAGDEVIFSIKSADPELLDDFIRAAIRECWYIDVYYHLRAELAEKIAMNLGMKLDEGGVFRVKESGVQLKIESFPSAKALTISYRIGWGDVSRDTVKRIHEKLVFDRPQRNLLRRIKGWMR